MRTLRRRERWLTAAQCEAAFDAATIERDAAETGITEAIARWTAATRAFVLCEVALAKSNKRRRV